MATPTPPLRGTAYSPAKAPRLDLSNRSLKVAACGLGIALVLTSVSTAFLPEDWQRPGSHVMQSAAAAGSLLLVVPFLFSYLKRNGTSEVPNNWFVLHVVTSIVGTFLVLTHASVSLGGPPLIMALFLVLLVVTGIAGRAYFTYDMAATFGSKSHAFGLSDPRRKNALRDVIDKKRKLLERLDPSANEGLFSVTPKHFVRAPILSWRYTRLARLESRLIGARQSVGAFQAWWRVVHILLAWLFLAALIAHVVTVTFFAGYVADGRDIYWWHLAAW